MTKVLIVDNNLCDRERYRFLLGSAFDRSYLARSLEQAGGNVTQGARSTTFDPKGFPRKRTQANFPLLSSEE
jgi:hypothetical protein